MRGATIDQIARGAGMSRAALYLHYRNKEDIFRRLAQVYYDEAADAVAAALAQPGSVAEQVAAAFAVQGGALIEAMLTSPHGMELIDSSKATAADIAVEGEARLTAIYADWLTRQAAEGRIGFDGSAGEVAATMTAVLKGIKTTVEDYATYAVRVRQIAALIGAGLARGA